MSSHTRSLVSLLLGLALVAAACSGGDDSVAVATPPVTQAPAANLPDAGADLLELLQFGGTPASTSTTTPAQRVEAELFVTELVKGYFEAAGARDWDAVYSASSSEFLGTCGFEEFAAMAGIAAEATEIVFSEEFEIHVVGDFASGRFEVTDAAGTLPIEGLLAVLDPEGWRMAINPCDVVAKVGSGDFTYPLVITTTTLAGEVGADGDGGADGGAPSDGAPIDPDLTTTTLAPGASTTTTSPDIFGPGGTGASTTTTTTLAPIPLTAADEAEIEAILKQFMIAEASQDYVSLHDAVPALFSCDATDTAADLGSFHWSPTALTFGDFEITGGNDEGYATFELTYTDSGETLLVEDFGAWSWGGEWFAAVHPCKWTLNRVNDGTANDVTIDNMEAVLLVARDLYAAVGDYDIPNSTLNAMFIDESLLFVGTPDLAGPGVVAYMDMGQEVVILTQSASGRWYCTVENALTGAHHGSSFLPSTVDNPDGCRSVTLSNPWSIL
ncbi:MAG: hypothetical protein V3U47_07555 [Acidimicrobiia bacterium]